mmetsp:Transcript_49672/g.155462  ORF Transcript_49672/g.155462 Transcript_49672/m.155462 type:complete len:211 (-) Transcript_49672:454-1086(-)
MLVMELRQASKTSSICSDSMPAGSSFTLLSVNSRFLRLTSRSISGGRRVKELWLTMRVVRFFSFAKSDGSSVSDLAGMRSLRLLMCLHCHSNGSMSVSFPCCFRHTSSQCLLAMHSLISGHLASSGFRFSSSSSSSSSPSSIPFLPLSSFFAMPENFSFSIFMALILFLLSEAVSPSINSTSSWPSSSSSSSWNPRSNHFTIASCLNCLA